MSSESLSLCTEDDEQPGMERGREGVEGLLFSPPAPSIAMHHSLPPPPLSIEQPRPVPPPRPRASLKLTQTPINVDAVNTSTPPPALSSPLTSPPSTTSSSSSTSSTPPPMSSPSTRGPSRPPPPRPSAILFKPPLPASITSVTSVSLPEQRATEVKRPPPIQRIASPVPITSYTTTFSPPSTTNPSSNADSPSSHATITSSLQTDSPHPIHTNSSRAHPPPPPLPFQTVSSAAAAAQLPNASVVSSPSSLPHSSSHAPIVHHPPPPLPSLSPASPPSSQPPTPSSAVDVKTHTLRQSSTPVTQHRSSLILSSPSSTERIGPIRAGSMITTMSNLISKSLGARSTPVPLSNASSPSPTPPSSPPSSFRPPIVASQTPPPSVAAEKRDSMKAESLSALSAALAAAGIVQGGARPPPPARPPPKAPNSSDTTAVSSPSPPSTPSVPIPSNHPSAPYHSMSPPSGQSPPPPPPPPAMIAPPPPPNPNHAHHAKNTSLSDSLSSNTPHSVSSLSSYGSSIGSPAIASAGNPKSPPIGIRFVPINFDHSNGDGDPSEAGMRASSPTTSLIARLSATLRPTRPKIIQHAKPPPLPSILPSMPASANIIIPKKEPLRATTPPPLPGGTPSSISSAASMASNSLINPSSVSSISDMHSSSERSSAKAKFGSVIVMSSHTNENSSDSETEADDESNDAADVFSSGDDDDDGCTPKLNDPHVLFAPDVLDAEEDDDDVPAFYKRAEVRGGGRIKDAYQDELIKRRHAVPHGKKRAKSINRRSKIAKSLGITPNQSKLASSLQTPSGSYLTPSPPQSPAPSPPHSPLSSSINSSSVPVPSALSLSMIATPTIPLPSFKEEEEYDAADGYQYSIERENELQWIKKSSSFFAFIRKHFHSSSACSDVILASPVAKLMHWMHSSNVIRDMNLRGKGTREVDAAIDDYLRANDFFVALLRGCRLICEETESQGQIGFSYPGFEAQHFDVGRFSIVDCVRFFRGLYETYSEEDWQGALRSKCIGKELMQTTPDVSGLYEMGHMEEAKNLSFQIAKGLFHNLSLASFFRCHPHSFIDETRVNWSNVRQWFGSDCVNYKHLKQWDNLSYVFNPSRQHLFAMLLAFENSKADPTKLTTRVACDYLGFFVFFRCLLAYRQEKLQYLSFAIRFWLSSGERKKSVKQANRESTLINLQSLIDKEERQLAELLHIIPKYQQLDNLMPQLRKRNASRVLDNFLPSRPTKEELKEKNLIFDGDSLKRAASPTSNLKHRFTPPPPLAPNHPLTSIHSPS